MNYAGAMELPQNMADQLRGLIVEGCNNGTQVFQELRDLLPQFLETSDDSVDDIRQRTIDGHDQLTDYLNSLRSGDQQSQGQQDQTQQQ